MKNIFTFGYTLVFVLFLAACETSLPDDEVKSPPNPGIIRSDFELGRAMFYDKQLSADLSVSCASCHIQEFGFADQVAQSKGINGKLTSRNSMPLQNLTPAVVEPNNGFPDTLQGTPLFWDGRETDIFSMVLQPFTNLEEHGFGKVEDLEKRVRSLYYYRNAYKDLYDVSDINSEMIANSLVAFITTIRTSNTRFDMFQTSGHGLSELELEGMELFFEKYDCNACHQVESPSGYLEVGDGFSNIGLDLTPPDEGRKLSTGIPEDAGKFKIPSLRNVTFTAPYMHDGRFPSLDSVIEHYSSGIQNDPNLDTLLTDDQGDPLQLSISKEERDAIVAFLGTLSDDQVVTDPNFSDPFEK